MSGTTETQRQTSSSQSIPSRRVLLNDPSQLPHDYSTTPGGTLFSTTPGGTRIIYDRAFLIQCRNSPLTKSPPANLPKIAGVTSPRDGHDMATIHENGHVAGGDRAAGGKPAARPAAQPGVSAEEQQFEMDI